MTLVLINEKHYIPKIQCMPKISYISKIQCILNSWDCLLEFCGPCAMYMLCYTCKEIYNIRSKSLVRINLMKDLYNSDYDDIYEFCIKYFGGIKSFYPIDDGLMKELCEIGCVNIIKRAWELDYLHIYYNNKHTYLIIAAEYNQYTLVKYLLKAGYPLTHHVFDKVTKNDNVEIFKLIYKKRETSDNRYDKNQIINVAYNNNSTKCLKYLASIGEWLNLGGVKMGEMELHAGPLI